MAYILKQMNNVWQISGPRQRFGSGSLHYGGSLPRRLLRQNTTSTVASASNSNSANQSSCGFKYAEAHEIATATLRHGCLQPTVGNFSDFFLPAKDTNNAVADKEFFRTCNVLPFSCTHLALWRGKVKDPRYMQNKKDSRISLGHGGR